MIQIFRVIYIILIGYLVLRMFRGGGCCGGHSNNRKSNKKNCDSDLKKTKILIEAEEKRNAIDI